MQYFNLIYFHVQYNVQIKQKESLLLFFATWSWLAKKKNSRWQLIFCHRTANVVDFLSFKLSGYGDRINLVIFR